MKKITKQEFLRRFADAERSIVVLSANADNSNYFEEYKNGLHAIKCGDAYIKDGRERVVVGVDGNYVELNDNAVQEEMAQELERLRQLDPSRKLSLRVYE